MPVTLQSKAVFQGFSAGSLKNNFKQLFRRISTSNCPIQFTLSENFPRESPLNTERCFEEDIQNLIHGVTKLIQMEIHFDLPFRIGNFSKTLNSNSIDNSWIERQRDLIKLITINMPVYREVSSEQCQTSKMEHFPKIVNVFQPLTFFAKGSILRVWHGS